MTLLFSLVAFWLPLAEDASARFECPQPTLASAQARVDTVIRTTRRLVPIEYRRLASMGEPAWPHFKIRGVVVLSAVPGVRYRRVAVRLCGQRAADLSWAVYLEFPLCQLPCSRDVALLAKTESGWRIWYSAYRHP